MRFSANVDALVPSATLAFAARARELRAAGRSIVDLSAGELKYPTPGYAADAGVEAIRDGKTGYPPTRGIPELCAAVSEYLQETCAQAPRADPSRVLVSAGVKQALFNCLFCLFQEGDEVLIPAPFWPTYLTAVRLCGAEPIVVPTDWSSGFQISVEGLERARTPRTRGLILNSPNNPCGAVYSRDLLRQVLAWCARHEVWLLSDEIYRRLYYAGPAAPSVYDVEERPEHVVLLDGVSKAFCMTGWRIGFAEGPEELIGKAADLQSQTTSGASAPSQYAAAAAIGESEEREAALRLVVERLERNRRIGCEALSGVGRLQVREPEGAIYLFAKLAEPESSGEVAEELLDAGVACLPGEPFGTPGYLRFNFAVEEEALEEGLRRVVRYFEG